MITFGDPRGCHIVAYSGNVWGWSAFYVGVERVAHPYAEGRGSTAALAVGSLWWCMHGSEL